MPTCWLRRPRPSGPVAEAARRRRRLWGWLRRLGEVGTAMVGWAEDALALRHANPSRPRTLDLASAWALLRRAGRWMRALRIRLKVEVKAARETGQSDRTAPDWHEYLLRSAAWLPRKRPPAIRIDDTPTDQVFAQICADLEAAAKLLRSPSAMAKIAAIAAAARELLGGPAEGWTPPPVEVAPEGLTQTEWNWMLPDAPPPRPPDSG